MVEQNEWTQKILQKTEILPPATISSTFLAVMVENFNTLKVPKWIKEKLLSSGFIPENNFSDFQNYILLETGYPFEFYDLEKLYSELKTSDFQLSIKKASENQKFLAKNNLDYKLDNSVLTVNANDLPISIAGLIESKALAISKNTTKLLIEGSIFNAGKIRQQSRHLNLRTDRSARYEKSLRNTYLLEGLYRLISLLRISNPDLTCKLHTSQKSMEEALGSILLRYTTINEILGPSLGKTYIRIEKITEYLKRLDFEFTYNESEVSWSVKIPHSRAEDITREIDLIEEIGRLHGFNNFLTTLPKIKTIGNEDSTYQTRRKITSCLLNLGFNELIHYSLVNQEKYFKNEVELRNPLLADSSRLRSSLLPSLLKTVQENSKQKNIVMEGFEYGHVFSFDPVKKFKEKEYLAGIFGGFKTKFSWTGSERALTWFEAKGKIEQFFHQLNLVTYWQKSSLTKREKLFHPYCCADIYLSNGKTLGSFGQLHPILANQLNLSSEIYLFEFDLESIEEQLQMNRLRFYKSYSLYPKIIKDLSVIVQRGISFQEIQEILYLNGTEFLSEINLLDEYRGPSIPEHSTSLCFQLIFQSEKKTLENKKIEKILQNLQSILIKKFHAKIRN